VYQTFTTFVFKLSTLY